MVRGVAAGSLGESDKKLYGRQVLDIFSNFSHTPFEEAKTLEDLKVGIQIIRVHLILGQFQQAVNALQGSLVNSLIHNLEAFAELLSILRPFFSSEWNLLPYELNPRSEVFLTTTIATTLKRYGLTNLALSSYEKGILINMERGDWLNLGGCSLAFLQCIAYHGFSCKNEDCHVFAELGISHRE